MSYPKVVYKSQAMGNDFVIFADFENAYTVKPSEVRSLCNRRFGLGADGLIRVGTKVSNDGTTRYFMDYYNKDGSLANMCGNGARTVGAFLESLNILNLENSVLELETKYGIKRIVKIRNNEYTVELGSWKADAEKQFSGRVLSQDSENQLRGRFVDVGNEHIVFNLTDSLNSEFELSLKKLSLKKNLDVKNLVVSESSSRFLEFGANFEFIEVKVNFESKTGEINMRVYERGVGETYSCGTGIAAAAISAYLDERENGLVIPNWKVQVPGGKARIDITDEVVILTGPATIVGKFEVNPGLEMATLYVDEGVVENG